eukprot:1156804-Pelagomonas_calceolata.AAC.2
MANSDWLVFVPATPIQPCHTLLVCTCLGMADSYRDMARDVLLLQTQWPTLASYEGTALLSGCITHTHPLPLVDLYEEATCHVVLVLEFAGRQWPPVKRMPQSVTCVCASIQWAATRRQFHTFLLHLYAGGQMAGHEDLMLCLQGNVHAHAGVEQL